MASKFKNKPVYYDRRLNQVLEYRPLGALGKDKDTVKFDSQFEFRVYQLLREYVADEYIHIHHPIKLKPKTAYSNAVTYVVDFLVAIEPSKTPIYVEAKGCLTPEAKLKFQVMELLRPEDRKLILLVSEKRENYFGVQFPQSLNLVDLRQELERKINNDEQKIGSTAI